MLEGIRKNKLIKDDTNLEIFNRNYWKLKQSLMSWFVELEPQFYHDDCAANK